MRLRLAFLICLTTLGLLPRAGWGFLIQKDRLLFPYGTVHNQLGVLLGMWYEDLKWGDLQHRIRARVLSSFHGDVILGVEQNVPYPTVVGLYHKHTYHSRNAYRVRYFNGQALRSQIDVSHQYEGVFGLYYYPVQTLILRPGITFGYIGQSRFQGQTSRIAEVGAKVNALLGKRSFHPEAAEGFIELDVMRLLHSPGATTIRSQVGGQMAFIARDLAIGGQIYFQWASVLSQFWFFQPSLGGMNQLAAYSDLAFLDKTLLNMSFLFNWRVYEGLLLHWVRQISLMFEAGVGLPLTTPNPNQLWDTLSLGTLFELKNTRQLILQLAYSSGSSEYSFFFTTRQYF